MMHATYPAIRMTHAHMSWPPMEMTNAPREGHMLTKIKKNKKKNDTCSLGLNKISPMKSTLGLACGNELS